MKTWEMIKELMENPNKRFKYDTGAEWGIVGNKNGSIVLIDCSVKFLLGEPIELNGGFTIQDWREVKEPVSWQEAFVAGLKGKKIKVDGQSLTYPNFESLHFALTYLSERPDYFENLMRGKWYID
ncbi:hypothetical protein [Stenotrophomonas maltophilia group sp. RNC7]|uniref:hypothetical protein n=1 Tax=Stenotrophomonas maltophilia group sp. RNC7 TaxID=3071467 RepID=UPI0027DF6705|nr:hypothetical protein [Stenotrophomonas maltophilia group sp. RNC7]MDQ4678572.1 hypothetical protein [Stenotrophomonas maltophilia group sp. RNC7]